MPQIYHLGKLIGDANPGHEILNSSGTAMTQRNKLQINNATITDDPTNDKTIVTPSGGGGGGSTIKVTTTETTLRGKNITLTGSTTLTATFDNNGVATFTGVTMTGTLTLYTSDGTSSATKTISVPYFGNYEEPISFWAAIINVTATGINGVTVYAKKNGVTAASATVTNGSASLTVNSTGTYTIELTVNPGADDEYTYSESVTVSAESTYSVSLPIFITTLAISTTSTELYSQTITVTKGGSTVGTTAFSAQGSATFRVHETGTYTLTCTYGGKDYSESITIVAGDDGTTKSISIETTPEGATVTPTDDIQTWLYCADIRDKSSYTTLSDVLGDSTTLLALMSDNNAVDYLVRSKVFIGKYGLIPAMESNSTPSGVVTYSSYYNNTYLPYYAFDQNSQTLWAANSAANEWIAYEFSEPTIVRCVSFNVLYASGCTRVKDFKIEAHDGVNWNVLLYSGTAENTNNTYEKTVTFENDVAYSKYRIYVSNKYGDASYYIWLNEVQFYATNENGIIHDSTAMTDIGANNYCADTLLADDTWLTAICNSTYFESVLNAKVPTMTSNTTPSGVASASSEYSSGTTDAYCAFDNDDSTAWGTASAAQATSGTSWVAYQWANNAEVKVYKSRVLRKANDRAEGYRVEAYNSSTEQWEQVYTPTNRPLDNTFIIPSEDVVSANKYRIFVFQSTSGTDLLKTVQFWGRVNV